MSLPNIATELNRVRRLRRLLEPLAVLYDKTGLDAGEEPFQLRLSAHLITNHAAKNSPALETIHIIDGESLKVTHEIWQEYRQIERELIEQREAAMSDKKGGDNTVMIPVLNQTVLDEKQENLDKGEQLLVGLDSLSNPERTWLEWFYLLSEDDKTFVELCGEKGTSVTPKNFDRLKEIVKKNGAEDPRLND